MTEDILFSCHNFFCIVTGFSPIIFNFPTRPVFARAPPSGWFQVRPETFSLNFLNPHLEAVSAVVTLIISCSVRGLLLNLCDESGQGRFAAAPHCATPENRWRSARHRKAAPSSNGRISSVGLKPTLKEKCVAPGDSQRSLKGAKHQSAPATDLHRHQH